MTLCMQNMTFGLPPPNLLEGHFPSDARSPSRCRSRTVPSTKAHSCVVPFSVCGHRQYAQGCLPETRVSVAQCLLAGARSVHAEWNRDCA